MGGPYYGWQMGLPYIITFSQIVPCDVRGTFNELSRFDCGEAEKTHRDG